MEFIIKPIGFIETPFEEYDDTPIQPGFSDAFGTVCVNSEYKTGLKDLDGFSHIILLYYFDRLFKDCCNTSRTIFSWSFTFVIQNEGNLMDIFVISIFN